jgi:rubrerythrin
MKNLGIPVRRSTNETANFRERVYLAGHNVSWDERVVSIYDVMRAFDKYLDETSGKWIEHQEGRWIYAKCSNCGTVHDIQTNYCPICGFAMERTDI